jgi:CRISPR/Cas system-associated endonuclease Cas1
MPARQSITTPLLHIAANGHATTVCLDTGGHPFVRFSF